MSTYYNPENNKQFKVSELDAPSFLKEYITFVVAEKGLSIRTANTYYIQLRNFLKYIYLTRNNIKITEESMNTVDISKLQFDFVEAITIEEIRAYITDCKAEGDKASTRQVKLVTIRRFFNYFVVNSKRLTENPAISIEYPKKENHLPIYLSLDECEDLLSVIDGNEMERDYCIVTFLLNCGLRLSELVGLNIPDINKNDYSVRVLGKGNKERIIYLNDACVDALNDYLIVRATIKGANETPALFISKRTGNRLTGRRIEKILEELLLKAGLSGRGFSPHKLRHTAATQMYRQGSDLNVLQKVLGHANVSTTTIYAHVSDEQVKEAMLSSPIAELHKKEER